MESYNNSTRGREYNSNGSSTCSDPFLREMQNAKMIHQNLQRNETTSILETKIEAHVGCSQCPINQPLFGDFEDQRYMLRHRSPSTTLNRNKFFQSFLGLILVGTEHLRNIKEIPSDFTTLSRAFVITTLNEKIMMTYINYIQRSDNNGSDGESSSLGTIEFSYQEDGQPRSPRTLCAILGSVDWVSRQPRHGHR